VVSVQFHAPSWRGCSLPQYYGAAVFDDAHTSA